jgi:glycosyltransferase involved in cell wall biosynthesis
LTADTFSTADTLTVSARRKLLFVVTEDWFFVSHFMERARAARDAGFDVVLASRFSEHAERIRAEGFRAIHVAFVRSRINPFMELLTVFELLRLYRQERPDIVHHIALKPIIYGTMVSRLIGLRRIVNAPVGMGYIFTSGARAGILRPLVSTALRLLLNPKGSRVVFENGDDLAIMTQGNYVRASDAHVIRGAGVDIEEFHPVERPERVPTVILVARMLWDKGVGDYVEAARLLRAEGIAARFLLVGVPDPHNPASVDVAQLRAWESEGTIEWLGLRRDIPDLLSASDIACLPTYYREGLPKTLLEGMAAGLPLVTTDVIGCREVVKDGFNGFLVPRRDPAGLAAALRRLILDKPMREKFGSEGRKRAVEEFSTEIVNAQTLATYAEILE